ncbi:MAG: AAA family ATPase [Clostridia bacterium]|nr:AAA family ATPase [Clostridia bacterium]
MELEGEVETIIYENEMNSYTVARFITEGETITIVGFLPFVNIGDTIKITGEFVQHKDYGEQFKVETFKKEMPKTLDALERYLGGGSIKWVGPKTAEKIIKTFGEETIYVLEKEPDKLATIKGITNEKALDISESFVSNKEIWKIVDFLEEIGIAPSYAKKVYELYGINAVEEIKNDPYRLIDVVRGISFKTIDEAALKIGVNQDDEQRIIYGIKYGLLLATYNGHTCVLKQNLLDFTSTLLEISPSTIEIFVNQLKVKGTLVVEERDDDDWVYLREYYDAETFVAGKLIRLDNVKNRKQITKIEEKIEKQEKQADIELSEKQKEAIKAVSKNNVCVITGGPGTGKTTIIKTIIELYKKEGKKVVLCAPTRKSSKENDRNNRRTSKNIT